jgi:hypothetical protein
MWVRRTLLCARSGHCGQCVPSCRVAEGPSRLRRVLRRSLLCAPVQGGYAKRARRLNRRTESSPAPFRVSPWTYSAGRRTRFQHGTLCQSACSRAGTIIAPIARRRKRTSQGCATGHLLRPVQTPAEALNARRGVKSRAYCSLCWRDPGRRLVQRLQSWFFYWRFSISFVAVFAIFGWAALSKLISEYRHSAR